MKAILVIEEMSESCGKCRLADFGKCWGSTSYIHMSTNDIPKECPLKPLPHKLQADWYTDGYKEGFNACLDAITGETGHEIERL